MFALTAAAPRAAHAPLTPRLLAPPRAVLRTLRPFNAFPHLADELFPRYGLSTADTAAWAVLYTVWRRVHGDRQLEAQALYEALHDESGELHALLDDLIASSEDLSQVTAGRSSGVDKAAALCAAVAADGLPGRLWQEIANAYSAYYREVDAGAPQVVRNLNPTDQRACALPSGRPQSCGLAPARQTHAKR